jgi:hypothetical protein
VLTIPIAAFIGSTLLAMGSCLRICARRFLYAAGIG